MKELQNKAKELLEKKEVDLIIGYGMSEGKVVPVFVSEAKDAEQLVWNESCFNNLALYLTKKEIKALSKVGIVAKGCDVKAIIGLIQESQVERDKVYIIGAVCPGMKLKKCDFCDAAAPAVYDVLIGKEGSVKEKDGKFADVEEFDKKSAKEREDFWNKHFERCIRCYACRQVCPLCYCENCITEKSQPQWIEKSAHSRGNFSFHIMRAFHLAGRCIGCGECERVCPMDIPLGLLNKKMQKEVAKEFGYKPGYDSEAEPVFTVFREDDKEEFIK